MAVPGERPRRHRTWSNRSGFIANVVIGVVIVAATLFAGLNGQWLAAVWGVIAVILFGLRPAMAAHRDGALYLTKQR